MTACFELHSSVFVQWSPRSDCASRCPSKISVTFLKCHQCSTCFQYSRASRHFQLYVSVPTRFLSFRRHAGALRGSHLISWLSVVLMLACSSLKVKCVQCFPPSILDGLRLLHCHEEVHPQQGCTSLPVPAHVVVGTLSVVIDFSAVARTLHRSRQHGRWRSFFVEKGALRGRQADGLVPRVTCVPWTKKPDDSRMKMRTTHKKSHKRPLVR